MKDIDFSALLCSRLCHDLISPVGAIANGIEILADEDDEMMRAEVFKLLESSAIETSNRLKFYRLAFGAAGGFGEKVPLTEAENAIKSLFGSGRVKLSFHSDIGLMDKNAMKVMLNMVLLAGECLIRGGEILVEIREKADLITVNVTIHGDKVIFQDSTRQALLGELSGDQVEAKSAPALLAASCARQLGIEIMYILHNEQSFSLQIEY